MSPDCVVLLHGWGMSGYATHYWRHKLRQAGWQCIPFAYRSISRTLDDNVARLVRHVSGLPADVRVHLVGHSLGGLVIMQCLARHHFPNLGRVVLVGSPFQGSAAAHRLASHAAGRRLLGRTILQWQGAAQHQMPVGLEVGTIAGAVPYGLGRLFGGLKLPHDGTVSVAETQVPFARDHLVMKVTHTEMLLSAAVVAQIASFLRHGEFQHA